MSKRILVICGFVALLLAIPVAGLVAFAIWLLITSPVIFGIAFISSLTYMVLKSAAAAVIVFALVSIVAISGMLRSRTPAVKVAADDFVDAVNNS